MASQFNNSKCRKSKRRYEHLLQYVLFFTLLLNAIYLPAQRANTESIRILTDKLKLTSDKEERINLLTTLADMHEKDKAAILAANEKQSALANKRQTIIYLLLVILGIFLLIAYRYNKWTKKQTEKKLREQLTRDIHDNVGVILNNLRQVAKETLEESSSAYPFNQQLELVANLSNQATVSLKDLIWQTKGVPISLNIIESELKDIASEHVQIHGLPYELTIQGFAQDALLPFKEYHNFLMIYQEALQNAIKHGTREPIKIAIIHDNNTLSLMMRNTIAALTDGAALINSSFQGIGNMKKRTKFLKGNILFEVMDTSFVVRLQLPISALS